MDSDAGRWVEPGTVADLHLPPTFVADHAIRALAYQGAMTPAEIARRWRVDEAIAVEVVASLKSGGLIELDSGQSTFERTGRVHLTAAGLDRVAATRRGTWYAGAVPVSFGDFAQRMDLALREPSVVTRAADVLRPLAIAPELADEIGQAVCAGATLALRGVAFDEQAQIARALGLSFEGDVSLPFALYAAGAVVRVFDPRYHRVSEAHLPAEGSADILRSRESHAQWATISRPVVTLSGGVQAGDVVPAYDEDARFYVAPMPFAACRGLLAVLDGDTNPAALAELARLWLIPGRHHVGVLLLRSGERIEVPWSASTLLFGEAAHALPRAMRGATVYDIDASVLDGESLTRFLANRLDDRSFPPEAMEAVATLLERRGLGTRAAAAGACQYLRDRAAYEGATFSLTPAVSRAAIDFAVRAAGRPVDADIRAAS